MTESSKRQPVKAKSQPVDASGETEQTVTVPMSIGSGLEVDPFLTHPRDQSPDTQALMRHCIYTDSRVT